MLSSSNIDTISVTVTQVVWSNFNQLAEVLTAFYRVTPRSPV
jgi:hypothetical protein